jgi:hypothetical protein
MKLSEAIRMNGMMKPQGFGPWSMTSLSAPCALGGALQILGRQCTEETGPNYFALNEQWEWLLPNQECPIPDCNYGKTPQSNTNATCVIFHLNDDHRWTRQQIADWVETIEPAELPALAEPEVLTGAEK